MGRHDCYVIGGRLVGRPSDEEHLLPSLWVDQISYDPLRIVRADGVEFRLGPIRVFDGVRLPGWIDILTTRGLRARLEITSVAEAAAPAALFQPDWLTTPAPANGE
jgi:hypothetical protein